MPVERVVSSLRPPAKLSPLKSGCGRSVENADHHRVGVLNGSPGGSLRAALRESARSLWAAEDSIQPVASAASSSSKVSAHSSSTQEADVLILDDEPVSPAASLQDAEEAPQDHRGKTEETPLQLLWTRLKTQVVPAELYALRKLVGERRIGRNKELLRELEGLESMLGEFQTINNSLLEKLGEEEKAKASLLQTPKRDFVVVLGQ